MCCNVAARHERRRKLEPRGGGRAAMAAGLPCCQLPPQPGTRGFCWLGCKYKIVLLQHLCKRRGHGRAAPLHGLSRVLVYLLLARQVLGTGKPTNGHALGRLGSATVAPEAPMGWVDHWSTTGWIHMGDHYSGAAGKQATLR